MTPSFAQRIATAQHLLVARCPVCLALNSADPSLRVATVCGKCSAVLMPRRDAIGISFVEHGRTAVTS